QIPLFLSGETNMNFSSSTGNTIGVNGSHALPWNGTAALTFSHSTFSGDSSSGLEDLTNHTEYSTNTETANFSFHPTVKLSLFASENYTDNLSGFLYQGIANGGGGVPINQESSTANSFTTTAGASYNILNNLYAQGQITYFQQSYFGNTYDGSYLSATLGY